MGQCVQVNPLEQRERKHTYHNQDLIHTVIPYDENEGEDRDFLCVFFLRVYLWIIFSLFM